MYYTSDLIIGGGNENGSNAFSGNYGGFIVGGGHGGMSSGNGSFVISSGNLYVKASGDVTGTNITLKDKSGKTIIECAPELSFAVVLLSSPDIVSGETYTITVGFETGEFVAS